jgi:hypothetical protein
MIVGLLVERTTAASPLLRNCGLRIGRESAVSQWARHAEDSIMVVYGLGAAAILRGDGRFFRFAQCCGYIVPHAKLAVREEFPDQIAATSQNFLLGA